MNRRLVIIGIIVVALGIVASSALYTVDQAQQALVLQFGKPIRVVKDAGLQVKIPFVQNVVLYDRRVLDLDPPVEQLILADQKRLDVDAFARFRIVDPLRFYQAVGTEAAAEARLNNIVNSAMRRVLGNVTLLSVLSAERQQVMSDIKQQVNGEAQPFGIDIVDVRIRRADLPEETSQAIYARMRSEREREAAEFRAEGQEQSQQVRARADRERTVLLAEAQRQGQVLRGEGDNQAFLIMAEATGRDPQFYAFYRTLQAYRDSIHADDTTFVLSPKNEFLRYFGSMSFVPGEPSAPPPPGGAPGPGAGASGPAPQTLGSAAAGTAPPSSPAVRPSSSPAN